MIDPELLPEFVAEAGEHLDEMEVNLIKLETEPDNADIINDIFRDVHTIKGSSAYLGLTVTSELAHKLENLLEIVRQGKRQIDSTIIDTLISARDRLASLVADIEGYQEEKTEIDDLLVAIEHSLHEPNAQAPTNNNAQQTTQPARIHQDPAIPKAAATQLSISEEELTLSLDDIFALDDAPVEQVFKPAEEANGSPAQTSPSLNPTKEQQSLTTSSHENSSTVIAGEEGEDQELFAIYIEQLQLNLSAITELADEMATTGELPELLETIKQKISRLSGSANYMGYDSLVTLCTNWQESLTAFQEQLSKGPSPSKNDVLNSGIISYFDAIKNAFPQLGEITYPQIPVNKADAPTGEQTLSNEQELTLELDAFFDCQEEATSDHAEAEIAGSQSAEETEDEELLTIFTEQVQHNLTQIYEQGIQISRSDDLVPLFTTILETINRLKGSANYMGYDSMVGLCERWQQTLSTLANKTQSTAPPSCADLIDSGLNVYLKMLQPLVPQLGEITPIPLDKAAESPCGSTFSSSPQDTVLQDAMLPRDENEFEESVDSELFAIFLEQLKDNLHVVQAQARQIPTNENPVAALLALNEKISRIRAAANYMGYETLTGLYDQWLAQLKAMPDPASTAESQREYFNRIQECIRSYSQKLYEIFPEIEEDTPEAETGASPDQESGLPGVEPILPSSNDQPQESTNSSLIDRTDELFSSTESAQEEEYQLEEPVTSFEETEQPDQQALANRLSAALDSALGAGEPLPEKPIPSQPTSKSTVLTGEQPLSSPFALPPEDISESKTKISASESSDIKFQEEATDPAGEKQAKVSDTALTQQPKPEKKTGTEPTTDKVFRQSLRIDANKIDELMNQAGELVINRAWFSQLFNELRKLEIHLQSIPELDKREVKQVKSFSFKFHEAIVALGRVANELQEGVMKVRMLPISQLFNRYPRLIRDLIHDTDKDIGLVLRGADTELDKMIIEEIADPLIHVIRNAVDHGIESIPIRKQLGKPEKGLLKLHAYHEDSHVVVEVTDDGRGIDLEAVQATALEKGLITKEQLSTLSRKEMTELIMRPGFSTASEVTRTSGRGVGMDVVRKNLENLNGTIEIDSEQGQGTSIRIKIPLPLAVIKALLVKVGGSLFTIPLIAVDETLQVRDEAINSIKGNEVIYLRDSTIPLIRLSTIFNLSRLKAQNQNKEKTYIVIVSAGKNRVGLVVDALRGQEEVVIKPLPDYLRDNRGFSGATILGDGRISLILDIHDLVHLTIGRQNRRLNEPLPMTFET